MARRLRFIPPGSLVEVTCRTLQGRLLLRQSPALRELTLGVLARAARLYPVEVHAFAFLSNHYHLLLTAPDALRLARFMNYLNSNLAREAGRLHRWREKFWGRRYQAILVADDEATQVERLRYVLSQGTKEGLVPTPLDWPGAHCARALLDGAPVTGLWYDRRLEHRVRTRCLVEGIETEAAIRVARKPTDSSGASRTPRASQRRTRSNPLPRRPPPRGSPARFAPSRSAGEDGSF